MQRIRRQVAGLALLSCLAPVLGMGAAHAQADWPKRAIKVIVPYPAGGSADAMGRMVANKLGKAFPKVSVVVENIPGGATVPGALATLRDPADGHTLFMASDGTLNINRWLLKDVRYDGDRDFTPVTVLNSYPHWLIINPRGPTRTSTTWSRPSRPGRARSPSASTPSAVRPIWRWTTGAGKTA